MKRAISISKLPEPKPEFEVRDLEQEVENTVKRALEGMLSDPLMAGGTRQALRRIIEDGSVGTGGRDLHEAALLPQVRMLNRLSQNLLRLPIRIDHRIDGDRCEIRQDRSGHFALLMSPLGLSRLRAMYPDREFNVSRTIR